MAVVPMGAGLIVLGLVDLETSRLVIVRRAVARRSVGRSPMIGIERQSRRHARLRHERLYRRLSHKLAIKTCDADLLGELERHLTVT
jgi:hypothetical protein